jgi:hypothetical protein
VTQSSRLAAAVVGELFSRWSFLGEIFQETSGKKPSRQVVQRAALMETDSLEQRVGEALA